VKLLTKLLYVGIPTFLAAGCSKVVVVQVPVPPAAPIRAEGVFYALPRTVVRIGIKVDKAKYVAGPYMKFAAIFAPGSDPVCKDQDCTEENNKIYSLQKAVTFSTFGEPDPTNVYMVKFVGGGTLDQTMALTWTDTGLISTASASVTNRTGDVIVSGLKLAAGIAAKSAFGASAIVKQTKAKNEHLACPHPSGNDDWILTILTSGTDFPDANDALVANFCEIPVDNPKDPKDHHVRSDLKYAKATPDNESLMTDAYTAYMVHIAPLSRARGTLLSGTSASFEPTALITKMDTLLDLQNKALYLGSTDTKTWEGSLDIRNLNNAGSLSLMHIDPKAGICLESNVAMSIESKLLPPSFTLLNGPGCVAAPTISMSTTLFPGAQLFQSVAGGTVAPAGELSFRYRIPAQVKADIVDGQSATYGSSVFSVAQLGVVAALPARRRSKTLSYDLAMVEATGGLKSFKTSSTGSVDAGTVDAASGIAGTLLDARNTSNAAKDEVNVLTRQDTILKLKVDICTQQKALGMDCAVQP
jgi:hypothetical protein